MEIEMTSKLINKCFLSIVALLIINNLTGCTALVPTPTPTATIINTATAIPTKTLNPTATITVTPEPSPTATMSPIFTMSVNSQSAISMSNECRALVDGLYDMKKDIDLPDHFTGENPFRQDSDFNPNQYFEVFTHLKIEPGYKLDYIYFNDDLGGLPLVYARESNSPPFQSYRDFLNSYGEKITGERSYTELNHKYDYLEKIQIDNTPESYFEYVTMALLGDQFYLWWHGQYNDSKILCDASDIQYIEAELRRFEMELPQDVKDKIEKIDFSPVEIVDENTVTVRFVIFTKWGGFFEAVYVINKENINQLLDVKFNPIIEYDCGISF
jgi:hypothetical protein